MGRPIIDLTGKMFGEWTVVERSHEIFPNQPNATFWLCRCSCGKTKVKAGQDLKKGAISCGCATSKTIDEVGNTYGNLTVIEYAGRNAGSQATWVAECSCGNRVTKSGAALRFGSVTSCGCRGVGSWVGRRFGRLLVVDKAEVSDTTKRKTKRWLCECDCGNKKVVPGFQLDSGDTNSCGCLRSEITKTRHKKYRESLGFDPEVSINGMERINRTIFSESKIRGECFGRDDRTCLLCGYRGRKIEAHHIETWRKCPERRFDLSNLATLCKTCHFEKVHQGNTNGPVDPEITEQLRTIVNGIVSC